MTITSKFQCAIRKRQGASDATADAPAGATNAAVGIANISVGIKVFIAASRADACNGRFSEKKALHS